MTPEGARVRATPNHALLEQLEVCYNAIPRENGARTEEFGPLVLFVQEGTGWPYYARPTAHVPHTSGLLDAIHAVAARQRELGIPRALEWIHEITPDLAPAAAAAGFAVHLVPLLVLDRPRPPLHTPAGVSIHLLDPDEVEFPQLLAISSAVAEVSFRHGSTEVGVAGRAARDAARRPLPANVVNDAAKKIKTGARAEALALTAQGALARGAFQAAVGAAEIVGVATLPAARRRGLAAAVTTALARRAVELGLDTIFLSAATDEVARIYEQIGFQRVGTAGIAEVGD